MKHRSPLLIAVVRADQAPKSVQRYMEKHGMDAILTSACHNGDKEGGIRVFFGKHVVAEPSVFKADDILVMGMTEELRDMIRAEKCAHTTVVGER